MMPLSIIIPTFNDERIIEKKINFLIKYLNNLKLKYEVILINDGSSDKTKLIIKKLLFLKNLYLLNNKSNKGKSFSILKGMKKTKYNHILLIDSDLPYFSEFRKVIKLLKNNDFVFINRRHKKSKVIKKDLNFYVLVRLLIGYLISFMLKITINLDNKNIDTQAGLKGLKKIKELQRYNFISNKFFLDIELLYLYKKLSKKIISVPVRYNISKSSTINLLHMKKNFLVIYELIKVLFSIYKNKTK